MKTISKIAKSLALVLFFAGSTILVGCNAADIAGPETQQSDCNPDCSTGRNL